MARTYKACLSKVNGSAPPSAFLDELVDWATTAPDDIFAANTRHDIYTNVFNELGPYKGGIPQRKAVMLEVLRVLAGHESTWRWNQGVDRKKKKKNTPHAEEAGAFQCSADAMEKDSSLEDLLMRVAGKTDDETFITTTKLNHAFAIEFAARLLRFTVNHHGPVKEKDINKSLKKAAVAEFQTFL